MEAVTILLKGTMQSERAEKGLTDDQKGIAAGG
jgi:hypothetical protein